MSHLTHDRTSLTPLPDAGAGVPVPIDSSASSPGESSASSPGDPSGASSGEDGSLVAEYGLLAIVAATLVSVLLLWGRTAVPEFFETLLDHARTIVGA